MGFNPIKEITRPFKQIVKQVGRSVGDVAHGVEKVLGEGFSITNEFVKSSLSPSGLMSGLIGWSLGGPFGALAALGYNAFGESLLGGAPEQMPTALAPAPPEAAPGTAKAADTAASETARRRAEEERRRRSLYGRASTFSGRETGLLGPAPIGKKTLLGQ